MLAVACNTTKAQCVLIASTKAQAGVVWRHLESLLQPSKKKHHYTFAGIDFWFREAKEKIELSNGSLILIKSTAPSGSGGTQLNLLIADEFAEWDASTARDVWARLSKNTMAKRGLTLTLTTAQWDRSSVAYETLEHCRRILKSQSEDYVTLPIVYEVPEEQAENWKDERLWAAANPAWGQIATIDWYRQELIKTKDSPIKENEFKTFYLNLWVGSSSQWLSPNLWALSTSPRPESDFHKLPAVIGWDHARSFDTSCYCLLFKDGNNFHAFFRYFIPQDAALKKQQADKIPWLSYQNRFNVVFTEGDEVDTAIVRQRMAEDMRDFRVEQIMYDPTSVTETHQEWVRQGIPHTAVNQNAATMTLGYVALEEALKQRRFFHPACPIADWMFNNCTAKRDTKERLMVQKSSESQRVDIIDAIAIAWQWHLNIDNAPIVAPQGQKWAMVW